MSIRDNPDLQRFELELGEHTAVSPYRRSPGVITFLHTEVPEAIAGKGVGTQLVRGALDLVRASGDKVVARCSFVARFIERNPEYQDLRA